MILQHSGKQLFLAVLLSVTALQACATLVIRPMPMDGHQHDRRASKMFTISGDEESSLRLWTPDLQSSELQARDGHINVKPTGKDNYHLLVASRLHNGTNETAIRYIPFNGKPTGHSPAELTRLDKARLDIVPDPLPREHWHYKAGDTVHFVVQFNKQPLASAAVTLSTSQGTMLRANTDDRGGVSFTLADDFPDTLPGRENNRPAELLVHVKHAQAEQKYATWLSADYQVNPDHWQDTRLGLMVASGGFIFGALVTGLGLRNASHKRGAK